MISFRSYAFAVVFCASLTGCVRYARHYMVISEYTSDRFSGRDLGSRTVTICPLLVSPEINRVFAVPDSRVMDSLQKYSPGINFDVLDREQHKSFYKLVSQDTLDLFFRLLSEGNIVQLQNMETIWKLISTDFLLVFTLRYAATMATFNKVKKKKIRIEAELWNCSEYEVVWRRMITGTTYDSDPDIGLVLGALGKIAALLPVPAQAYDNSKW